MMESIITAVAGLVGALVGGLCTIWAATRSFNLQRTAQTEHEKETALRIRTMLSLEIDDNLSAFEKFDLGIDERILLQNSRPVPKERSQELSDTPLQERKHFYWDSLSAFIPVALTPEEIKQCHAFHSHFEELVRLKGLSRVPQGTWHKLMEQSIAGIKAIKNPLK